jgi:pimeloyl-ACP methyl ester carboxylesterase
MNLTPQDALSGVAFASVDTLRGQIQFRSAGAGPRVTHVLLHGIGSASASWAYQLGAAVGRHDVRVLAWDAPGYGTSAHLPMAAPSAQDYAERLWAWLDALSVSQPVVLAGHSLGALMAASAAHLAPARVSRLVLLAPARGYGDSPDAERERVVQGRLSNLQQLGPQGMAQARAAAMLSPQAAPVLQDAVRETMAQIDPTGYTQAVKMLGQGRLADDLATWSGPLWIASGDADTVTTPAACDALVDTLPDPASTARISLGAVGHACPLEAPDAVNTLLGLRALA